METNGQMFKLLHVANNSFGPVKVPTLRASTEKRQGHHSSLDVKVAEANDPLEHANARLVFLNSLSIE